MKKMLLPAILVCLFLSCKNESSVSDKNLSKYAIFGDTISVEGMVSNEEIIKKYEALKEGDTIEVKFQSKIEEVCKKKGCWMKLTLDNNKEAFVKFKDYAFFVPKNADGSQAIVSGKAFVNVETIAEQKHYAQDAGASQSAIDSIMSTKKTYSFLADGVLIKK